MCQLVRRRQLVLSERAASCVVLLGIERHAFNAVHTVLRQGRNLFGEGGRGGGAVNYAYLFRLPAVEDCVWAG